MNEFSHGNTSLHHRSHALQFMFSLICSYFCSVASMRLAYKELEIDRKMEEKKIQNLQGKKKEQAERLGMGFGQRRYQLSGLQ